MPCWRSIASAAFKSVAAKGGMTTGNSMCGTASPIRRMPMRSVIGSEVSGRPSRDPVSTGCHASQPKHASNYAAPLFRIFWSSAMGSSAMKTLNRTILGAMPSALLLSGSVLCNFGAQADVHVPYPKIGGWSLEYLEVGNLKVAVQRHSFRIRPSFKWPISKAEPRKFG
jgi:hypothetical protein